MRKKIIVGVMALSMLLSSVPAAAHELPELPEISVQALAEEETQAESEMQEVQDDAISEPEEVQETQEISEIPEETVQTEAMPEEIPEDPPVSMEKTPGWMEENGHKYFLDENLQPVTGWKLLRNTWYYFDPDGSMAIGFRTVRGMTFYMDENGVMQTGWFQKGSTWYFANEDGVLQTGWLLRPSGWYYLNADGSMAQGWIYVRGYWYYMRPGNGDMLTGWFLDGSTWYYANADGVMQTGWLHTASGWYYLTPSGAMAQGWAFLNGAWYYLRPGNGDMLTGWYTVGNTWYYSNASGAMQTGWIYDGKRNYYLNPDGSWKSLNIAVVGYNNADAVTCAAKLQEMGVNPVIVTGAFDASLYDGMMLPGGGDLDPARYGQLNTASSNIDNALDDRQIDAVKQCVAKGKPVLGICKGVQLINVAFGGTLNQNIGGHMGVWHPASVTANGWLSGIYSGSVSVLSYHHQSIARVADGFQVDMRSPDGTVEAISNASLKMYGVQFHPEQMSNGNGNRCLQQFVVICN